jgi:hypothetical protein
MLIGSLALQTRPVNHISLLSCTVFIAAVLQKPYRLFTVIMVTNRPSALVGGDIVWTHDDGNLKDNRDDTDDHEECTRTGTPSFRRLMLCLLPSSSLHQWF